ncbi:hypothetical protein ACIQV3_38350 [Streptomyces sp. NPDC099050]|uniref:hypothetical protein n=1 Tax=Streptomyces sp. NPDC099050 TaxID=3366100 RepID=UPI0037F7229E
MPGPARGGDGPDARRLRTILISVCIALMAGTASVSGLNVAQPDLAVGFGARGAASPTPARPRGTPSTPSAH